MSANGYAPTEISLPVASATISGVVTDQVVSKETRVTRSGSTSVVLAVLLSGVAVTGAITLKLQTALGDTWEDSKTASITTDGMLYLRLLETGAGDQTYLPLLCKVRLVVTTTDAADEVVVEGAWILQGE